jgi:iron-sulfur cluster assembly protein
LALDEPRENDDTYDVQGYSFVVERALNEQTGTIRIDMTQYGFTVDSESPMQTGGGGCGSSCSSGSCSG